MERDTGRKRESDESSAGSNSTFMRDALAGTGLAVLTMGLIVQYVGDEPFPAFRLEDACLYLGLGSVTVVGWSYLVYRAAVRLIRGAGSPTASVVVLVASLVGVWMSTRLPWGYIEDLARLEPGWRSVPRETSRE
jgi:hypothetical protein